MHPILSDQEALFGYDEIFYSRTDLKGRILSGNSVFERVSGFEWAELEARPHSVVRHPDMPRAVFSLLWQTIQAGKPLGAYVKNRSKDGAYYWVFALAMPVEGGYISVRIKPGSPVFEAVKKEYAALLELETSRNLKPEQSLAHLLERLAALGFPSYEAFMTAAIQAEISHRQKALSGVLTRGELAMESLGKAVQGSIDESSAILSAYEECLLVPLNLEVRAARLGRNGGEISVVSESYRNMMFEIKGVIEAFSELAKQLSVRTREATFLYAASILCGNLATAMKEAKEIPLGGGEGEIRRLDDLAASYRDRARGGLEEAEAAVEKFRSISLKLRRLGGNLQMVRVAGLIGATQFPKDQIELVGELDKLQVFQEGLKRGLKAILFASERMLFDCDVTKLELRMGVEA